MGFCSPIESKCSEKYAFIHASVSRNNIDIDLTQLCINLGHAFYWKLPACFINIWLTIFWLWVIFSKEKKMMSSPKIQWI